MRLSVGERCRRAPASSASRPSRHFRPQHEQGRRRPRRRARPSGSARPTRSASRGHRGRLYGRPVSERAFATTACRRSGRSSTGAGPRNAITDVPGVIRRPGHDPARRAGSRTHRRHGAILPKAVAELLEHPVPAGDGGVERRRRADGLGSQIREWGLLETPIALTRRWRWGGGSTAPSRAKSRRGSGSRHARRRDPGRRGVRRQPAQ